MRGTSFRIMPVTWPVDLGCCIPPEESETSSHGRAAHGHSKQVERFASAHGLSAKGKEELEMLLEQLQEHGGEHSEHNEESLDTSPLTLLFARPSPIQKWDEPPPEIHAGFQSLFLDLVYVGIAFQLGDMLKYSFYSCTPGDASDGSGSSSGSLSASGSGSLSGSGSVSGSGSGYVSGSVSGSASTTASGSTDLRMARMLASGSGGAPIICPGLGDGLLHLVIFYMPLFNQWCYHVEFFAKYHTPGLIHNMLEFCFLGLLICAASCIEPVHYSRDNPMHLWFFCLFNLCCLLIWQIRYGLNAMHGRTKNLRLESFTMLVANTVRCMIFVSALVLASCPTCDGAYDATLALLVCAGAAQPAYLFVGGFLEMRIKDRRNVTTPFNVGFLKHRIDEFMMLMLGESVLQVCTRTCCERKAWPPSSHHISEPPIPTIHLPRADGERQVAGWTLRLS